MITERVREQTVCCNEDMAGSKNTHSTRPREVLHNQIHLYEAKSVPLRHQTKPRRVSSVVRTLLFQSPPSRQQQSRRGDGCWVGCGQKRLTETLVRFQHSPSFFLLLSLALRQCGVRYTRSSSFVVISRELDQVITAVYKAPSRTWYAVLYAAIICLLLRG